MSADGLLVAATLRSWRPRPLFLVLKVFDVVFVMTSGNFDTDVVASRMYAEAFRFFDFGRGSALAVLLFIIVVPFMLRTVRRMRRGVGMKPGRLVIWIFLGALVIIWTAPTLGLLVSSFRPADAVANSGWWTAFAKPFASGQWTLRNYERVILADNMGNAFLNSLLVAIPSTVIPITIAAFAAYAIAWMDFPGRHLILIIIVSLLIVPLQMALIPVPRLYTSLRLNGTFLGIWLAHTGFGLPLATYLLYGYIASAISSEIIESAHTDGATPWVIFTRLVLPLSTPVVASFAIFQFLWVWNDLLVALVFLGTKADNALVTTRLAEPGRFPRAGLARADLRSVRDHRDAVGRLLLAAALLRARADGRIGQGVTPSRPGGVGVPACVR